MNKRGKDYTTVELQFMRDAVKRGESIKQIASQLKRSYASVSVTMNKHGIRIRDKRFTPEQVERIMTCSDNKLLALEMDRTPTQIINKRFKTKRGHNQ